MGGIKNVLKPCYKILMFDLIVYVAGISSSC